jgi:hypothetical protein
MLFGTSLTGLVREPQHRRSHSARLLFSLTRTRRTPDGTVKGEAGLELGWRSVSGLHDAEAVVELVPFSVNLTMPDHITHRDVGKLRR